MKHARKAKGMSLADVASRSGLLPEAIARAERPGVDPRVSTVIAIARAIGVPICELLNEGVKHERHGAKRKAVSGAAASTSTRRGLVSGGSATSTNTASGTARR